MKQIILQVGDRVHHKTLGDGVVIAVYEDYGTARFGEKEANFRIPESFVRGFITSEDARFGSDETEEPPVVEMTKDSDKEKPVDWKSFWIGFIGMSIVAIPLSVFFFWVYRSFGGDLFMWIGIIWIIAYVGMSLASLWATLHHIPFFNETTSRRSRLTGTDLMAGMMGAELIDWEIKRGRKEAEKRRYDSLYWQESIRDKNPRHDFDYDKMDD